MAVNTAYPYSRSGRVPCSALAFALALGYSAFPATGRRVTIDRSIAWHGTPNAFEVALPGLLAVRLLDGRE